jgi:hypothetical protein
MICTSTENPWLLRVEAKIEYTEIIDNLVALENLDWHNQGIFHQIVVDHAVEDIDSTLI